MSLSKQQLWNQIVGQNPDFKSKGINLGPAGLDKFYNLVWDEAYKRGKHDKKLSEMAVDGFEATLGKIKDMMGDSNY